jgi:regulator of cell morphogenesis and NO signaling
MAMINPSTTLAEIASTAPVLTRELERLGLDYCCGGKRSLAEACREQQLDPEAVIAELAAVPLAPAAPADWIGLAPAEVLTAQQNGDRQGEQGLEVEQQRAGGRR